MPRPKGSKNKLKARKQNRTLDYAAAIESKKSEKVQLEQNIAKIQKEISQLKEQLKANRQSLKTAEKAIAKLETQKAAKDAQAAQQAYQDKLDTAIQNLLAQGMSMDSILEKLNG